MQIADFEQLYLSQETVPISITIVNDVEPELEETFEVELVSVDGGARLGSDNTVVVTILRSDDINGVFQFTGLTVVSIIRSHKYFCRMYSIQVYWHHMVTSSVLELI